MKNAATSDTVTVSFLTDSEGTIEQSLLASTPLYLRPDGATSDSGLMVGLAELIPCGTLGRPVDNAGWSVAGRPCLYVPGNADGAGEDVGEAIENFLAETEAEDTITDEQIRGLREEAIKASDREQIAVCMRALNGSDADRAECARVIADAQAQADD